MTDNADTAAPDNAAWYLYIKEPEGGYEQWDDPTEGSFQDAREALVEELHYCIDEHRSPEEDEVFEDAVDRAFAADPVSILTLTVGDSIWTLYRDGAWSPQHNDGEQDAG